MSAGERQYLDLLSRILEHGDDRQDRTGVGTRSIFADSMRFDLSDGTAPILTTKRVNWRAAVIEMLWMLDGETNSLVLQDQGVNIWREWADDCGNLGPIYGEQWRRWRGVDGSYHDQVRDVIDALRDNPASRRMIISGWNVAELEGMALPPCHLLYQFHVSKGRLNCAMYQRSADAFLGLPFNLVGASVMMMIFAQHADLDMGSLTWFGGDIHLYKNHFDQAREQLTRNPRKFPRMATTYDMASLDRRDVDDFVVSGYNPHPAIKAEVAV